MGLENLRARLSDPSAVLDAIGFLLVGRAQRAFKDQGRGGTTWPDRAVPNRAGALADLKTGPNVKERRWDARPAGIDTGRLLGSIAHRVEGRKVIVGSQLDYASDVQLGSAKTIELTPEIRANLNAWLKKLSNSAKRARRDAYPAKEARYQAARAAFGPLFRIGALHTNVPPRPFILLTDEDRLAIYLLVARFFRGE